MRFGERRGMLGSLKSAVHWQFLIAVKASSQGTQGSHFHRSFQLCPGPVAAICFQEGVFGIGSDWDPMPGLFGKKFDRLRSIATGSRSVLIAGLVAVTTRTATQLPSGKGSETITNFSPYSLACAEAL